MITPQLYCLDSNVLIQAWQKYYSPALCPSYWDVLDQLGCDKKIFIPQEVFDEITKTEDELSGWLKMSHIPVNKTNQSVANSLRTIFSSDPSHRLLVDNVKQRSLADPWVIAHAMSENACVVTKEQIISAANAKQVKIPNVCKNMNIRCIDDFEFAREMEMKFSCTL